MCPGFMWQRCWTANGGRSLRERPARSWRIRFPGASSSPASSAPHRRPSFTPSHLPALLAHLSPFPSEIPACPLCAASLPLFPGQELLICNSIGAKCFAKLLKQLKATGWREKHYKHFTNNYVPVPLTESLPICSVCLCERSCV